MKTIYDIKEYSPVYSGNKGAEEQAVVAVIMTLLNNNKFDNIDDALRYSGNSLSQFLKNNNRDVVPLHYGNALKDGDFQDIIDNFKEMINKKMVIDEESLHKSNFDDKEYVEHNGTVFSNDFKEKEIEDELKDIQQDNPEYQSTDASKNTDALVEHVVDNKKEEVKFVDLESLDRDNLNDEQRVLYDAAKEQKNAQNLDNLQVSFEQKMTKDEDNNLRQLKDRVDGVDVVNTENEVEVSYDSYSYLNEFDISTFDSMQYDVYQAAVNYQFNVDEPIRLNLDGMSVIDETGQTYDIIEQDGTYVVNDERFMEKANQNSLEKEKVKVLKLDRKWNNETEDLAA